MPRGKKPDPVAELRAELEEKSKELQERQAQLEQEASKVVEAEKLRAQVEKERGEIDSRCGELQTRYEEQQKQLAELQTAHQKAKETDGGLNAELVAARSKVEEAEAALGAATGERTSLEAKLAESAILLEEHRKNAAALEKRCEAQAAQISSGQQDRTSSQHFVDVAVGECEFASAFAYSVSVQLQSRGERRSTDVSQPPSQRPVFKNTSFLLHSDAGWVEDSLLISAYVHVSDPASSAGGLGGEGGRGVARLLGEASLPLNDLRLQDGATSSRRAVRTLSFVRVVGSGGAATAGSASSVSGEGVDAGRQLTVGRATISLQAKVLTSSELAEALPSQVHPSAPMPASFPSLDRSLWASQPFQHRLRVLVHRAGSLPPAPRMGQATVRVALRLSTSDGQVLHECFTGDVPISGTAPPGEDCGSSAAPGSGGVGACCAEALFAQELLVPVPERAPPGLAAQLALEMVSVGGAEGGRVTTASLLDLQLRPEVLPSLHPLHLLARPSQEATPVPSAARPRPTLLVSLTREPAEEALDALGDGASHGVELRLHGVPVGRPLPEPVDNAMLAICAADEAGVPLEMAALRVPVATYFYDQRLDLASFVEAHFRSSRGDPRAGLRFFLSPMVGRSRTPSWSQFVLKFLASTPLLSSLSVLLFDGGGGLRADPEAPLGATLLGLATFDASALASQDSAEPLQRSFQPDLRLLEAPGASASLEVEVRVWPRGRRRCSGSPPEGVVSAGASLGAGGATEVVPGSLSSAPVAEASLPPPAPMAALSSPPPPHGGHSGNAGATSAALQNEARDLRLNHELSVQLAKEFNMRAAALKRAGEEIVELRRQVQVLHSEKSRLQAQLDDELRLVQDVQQRPLPDGIDSLSGAELAAKLQRALEKYREERAKGVELGRRLEEASKEVARGRGLQRSLDELERAHLEQNRELQRLQEENRKMDTYKQTTKAQEKVISKLEKILESSLQEVQKAQRVQVDVERMKTENMRLRERCAQLVARTGRSDGGSGAPASEDLRRMLAQKDDEVARLQGLIRDLQRSTEARSSGDEQGRAGDERQRLEDQESRRLEWEQRCQAAEHRLQMLQQQLTESSKRYGAELSSLRVEIAKRDARILELEYLLNDGGGRAIGTSIGAGAGA